MLQTIATVKGRYNRNPAQDGATSRTGERRYTRMGEYTDYGYIGPDGVERATDSTDEAE